MLKRLFVNSGLHFFKIRASLQNIRSHENPEVEEHDTVSFNEKCNRFTYVFAYGVIHSVIMHSCFLNLLKSNLSMLRKIVSMKTVRLCILGGGPALEVTSFIKLFSNILACQRNMDREPRHVDITIIDECIGWKKDAELIVYAAEKYFCILSNIQIHFSFVAADLTRGYRKGEMRKAITKADFVTMVSGMNSDCFSNLKPKIPDMIGQIIEWMKFKSCLFLLDTSGGDLFCNMDEFINQHILTERIYGPCLHNEYILSVDSMQKLSKTLRHIFHDLKCFSRCKSSCSAWLKVRTVTKVDGSHCNAENVPSELLNDSPLT